MTSPCSSMIEISPWQRSTSGFSSKHLTLVARLSCGKISSLWTQVTNIPEAARMPRFVVAYSPRFLLCRMYRILSSLNELMISSELSELESSTIINSKSVNDCCRMLLITIGKNCARLNVGITIEMRGLLTCSIWIILELVAAYSCIQQIAFGLAGHLTCHSLMQQHHWGG